MLIEFKLHTPGTYGCGLLPLPPKDTPIMFTLWTDCIWWSCACWYSLVIYITLENKTPTKRFQNFHQSCVLLTDRIEIHQWQPNSMTQKRLEGHTSDFNWWIPIWSVNNTQDWRKFWKSFRGCFVFQSRLSTNTVVKVSSVSFYHIFCMKYIFIPFNWNSPVSN